MGIIEGGVCVYPDYSGQGASTWAILCSAMRDATSYATPDKAEDLIYGIQAMITSLYIHQMAIEELSTRNHEVSSRLRDFMTDPDFVMHLFARGAVDENVTGDVPEFKYR